MVGIVTPQERGFFTMTQDERALVKEFINFVIVKKT